MLKDSNGLPVTTFSRQAVELFDRAVDQALSYRGDPIATLDQALAEDPGFVMAWALRANLLCFATDKLMHPEIQRSLDAARAHQAKATDRERAHLAAAASWLAGNFAEANARWGRIAQDHPRDIVALLCAHVGDFFLGQQFELRDRPLQARRAWTQNERGFGYITGMASFGLEETGDYARAEDFGRLANSLNPYDAWAVHAVTHVYEMQGAHARGIAWLTERQQEWAPDNGFAYHNWWHLAVFHFDLREYDRALKLYDEAVLPAPSSLILQMIDASALLWRLHLAGVDVGSRFAALAENWQGYAEQAHYAFNDVHAVMAFAGAGRTKDVERTLAAMRGKLIGDNIAFTRDVGLPIAEGIAAFAQGRYGDAADLLHPVRAKAQRFGGSHAQRDAISLTLVEAALRAGRKEQAAALIAERQALKPSSAYNKNLATRLTQAGTPKIVAA